MARGHVAAAVGANLEREIFDDAALRVDLDAGIREVVRDYFTARRVASKPKNFRSRIKRLEATLVKLLYIFPKTDDDLTEALNSELYRSDDEDSPDVQQIRTDLEALLKIVEHLREEESGPGMDAYRPKHQLARGLAGIFETHTGLKAGFKFSTAGDRSGDDAVCGPFAEFFKAVNMKIAEISSKDKVIGLEALIRPLRR